LACDFSERVIFACEIAAQVSFRAARPHPVSVFQPIDQPLAKAGRQNPLAEEEASARSARTQTVYPEFAWGLRAGCVSAFHTASWKNRHLIEPR